MAALEATASFIPLVNVPNMQLLVTGLCLAGALLVGALIIAVVSRWRKNSPAREDQAPTAQLAHFRSLYEKGAISQEEFERLRTLLGPRLRESMGIPAPAPERPAQPPGGNGQPPETGIRPGP